MAERLNNPLPQEKYLSWAPPSLLPQGAATLSLHPPDPSWPSSVAMAALQTAGRKVWAVVREDQNSQISFPSQGSCCYQEAAPAAQTHLAHLLSLLCMHPDWLVFICVGKNARQLRSPPHPVALPTPSGALPPPQPSTLSPEPAAHQREVTRLPDSPGPWARAPRKAADIARAGQGKAGTSPAMGECLCQVYRRNFSLRLGMIVPLAIPPFSHNYSQPSKD